jgi:hypothetical protein
MELIPMIRKVIEELNGDELKITIHTEVRDFIVNPTIILNDKDIIKIASKNHKVSKIISRPKNAVGNSIRSGIKQIGTWVVQIELETKKKNSIETPSKKEEEPQLKTKTKEKEETTTPTPSPRPRRRRPSTKKASTSRSIRDKMKNISNKTKERP